MVDVATPDSSEKQLAGEEIPVISSSEAPQDQSLPTVTIAIPNSSSTVSSSSRGYNNVESDAVDAIEESRHEEPEMPQYQPSYQIILDFYEISEIRCRNNVIEMTLKTRDFNVILRGEDVATILVSNLEKLRSAFQKSKCKSFKANETAYDPNCPYQALLWGTVNMKGTALQYSCLLERMADAGDFVRGNLIRTTYPMEPHIRNAASHINSYTAEMMRQAKLDYMARAH